MKRTIRTKSSLGYGKRFEKSILDSLTSLNVEYKFEGIKLSYTIAAQYKPDVVLDNGVIIEIKTYLPYEEQRKLRAVKESHPDLDLRLLFEKPDKKLPNSKLTHGEWATKYNFIWAGPNVPEEWYNG